jgi:phosphoribosylaminoimidazole-succinocarboxamide synthase
MNHSLSELPLLYRGKVREVYDFDADHLLLVTSSRVSAFDVVFPEPVPHKAEVLNLLSAWWFGRTQHIIRNHLVTVRSSQIFGEGSQDALALRGRVALVRKATPVRFECVVRGHLDGSALKEYKATGNVGGCPMPKGLLRYDRLPEPVFTPATKAETGHDENITVTQLRELAGAELANRLQKESLALYDFAYDLLVPRGILLLDTKFEFGHGADGELMLIDEIFTPDSSRYRLREAANEGDKAFDKQFLRDWLEARSFRGEGRPPQLPHDVLHELSRRYVRAFELITGTSLAEALARQG